VRLVVSIDVEEEGLFTGEYARGRAPVRNVPWLGRLDPLFRDAGIRPTLLISYQVARHPALGELLGRLGERWRGEIGAHLHPWNTPPLDSQDGGRPVSSESRAGAALVAKMESLEAALGRMGFAPNCFRMGRFNLGPRMLEILAGKGYAVDSSVAPMRCYGAGPDHLRAPCDPYFPDPADPASPGGSPLLEVPLTIVPVVPGLGRLLERARERNLVPRTWVSLLASRAGSLPVQPVWTGLGRMKLAARLHRRRGGRVLNLFFHSSELMPGGSPAHPSEAHVERFLARLGRMTRWLLEEMDALPVTLSSLANPGPGRCHAPAAHDDPA
jgi:hypothetical protein